MGMKDLCRYPNRGGCPSFILALCPPLSPPSLWSPLYLSIIQKATNLNIFWCGLVFCRENRRLWREKIKQIFSFGVVLGSVSAFFVLLLSLLSYLFGWLCCVIPPPSWQKQTKTCYFQINPYLVRCFVGFFGDQKRQKSNIFWKVGTKWVLVGVFRACLSSCPLMAGVRALCGSGPTEMMALVLWSCVSSFLLPFLLCAWCVSFEYSPISHFKGFLARFVVVVWVCIGCVLCVLYWLILRVRG